MNRSSSVDRRSPDRIRASSTSPCFGRSSCSSILAAMVRSGEMLKGAVLQPPAIAPTQPVWEWYECQVTGHWTYQGVWLWYLSLSLWALRTCYINYVIIRLGHNIGCSTILWTSLLINFRTGCALDRLFTLDINPNSCAEGKTTKSSPRRSSGFARGRRRRRGRRSPSRYRHPTGQRRSRAGQRCSLPRAGAS